MKKLTKTIQAASTLVDAHTHSGNSSFVTVFQNSIVAFRPDEPYYSLGIHPQDAGTFTPELFEQLKDRLQDLACIAVGECGLDTLIDVPMETQEQWYIRQLELAAEFNMPIILHCVHTWDRCRFLHSKYAPKQPLVFHGFARPSIVQSVLDYSPAMISLGHRLLHSKPLQECAAALPLERLFLETDNADVDLTAVYEELARLKSLSLRSLKEQLSNNFKRVFGDVEMA